MTGIRVVELGMWVAAPSAASVLADWGADVIRVESPSGDPMRRASRAEDSVDQVSPYFDPENRGKRSVVLDLGSREGRRSMQSLIAGADVFLTNVRLSALARFELGHESLLAEHSRLIYALITSFVTWWS